MDRSEVMYGEKVDDENKKESREPQAGREIRKSKNEEGERCQKYQAKRDQEGHGATQAGPQAIDRIFTEERLSDERVPEEPVTEQAVTEQDAGEGERCGRRAGRVVGTIFLDP